VRVFYQENFTGESERHIKEGSENGQLSPSGPVGEPGGGFVYCGLLRDR